MEVIRSRGISGNLDFGRVVKKMNVESRPEQGKRHIVRVKAATNDDVDLKGIPFCFAGGIEDLKICAEGADLFTSAVIRPLDLDITPPLRRIGRFGPQKQ